MRLIDADKLKAHYSWWGEDDKTKKLMDEIVDQQETVMVQANVTHCSECRYYGPKYHRCGLFGCDKFAEGFCDEAVRRPE